MAVSDHVDAEGPRQHPRAGTANNVNTNNNEKIILDSTPTLDHTSRSDSHQEDMEKDAQKPRNTESPSTTPKRSKQKIALIMTALAVCYAELYIEIERA